MGTIKALVIVAAAVLLAGCGHEKAPETAAAKETAPVAVRTVAVGEASLPAYYEATGTVRAKRVAVISAKLMGYVREVKAGIGDPVKAGQTLVVLDARDVEAGYRQAEAARNEARSAVPEVENAIAGAKANLDLAEVTFKRMQDLFGKKSISNQEYDEAQMRLKVARAGHEMALAKRDQLKSKIEQAEQGVRSAEVMKSYSVVTAPFDGIVTEKNVELGNLAAPGQPLLTVEGAGGFRLEASIEEGKLGVVRPGMPVAVQLDALGKEISGRVTEVVPAVDAASRTFIAKIDLPASPQIPSGLFGRARFKLGERRGISVPPEAVVERGQLASVYVAEGGRAHARLVTLGERSANSAEVLSGLNTGDRLIYPIPANLADGSRVEVRQ